MTTFKTIAATAAIAVVGTVTAFTGLHLGQSPADAATVAHPAKAKTTYVIKLTPQQLAKMLQGQRHFTGVKHQVSTHNQRQATNHSGTYRSAGSTYSRSGSTYSQRNGYRCYNYGGGSRSGSWGGSSHSGSCGGGCW